MGMHPRTARPGQPTDAGQVLKAPGWSQRAASPGRGGHRAPQHQRVCNQKPPAQLAVGVAGAAPSNDTSCGAREGSSSGSTSGGGTTSCSARDGTSAASTTGGGSSGGRNSSDREAPPAAAAAPERQRPGESWTQLRARLMVQMSWRWCTVDRQWWFKMPKARNTGGGQNSQPGGHTEKNKKKKEKRLEKCRTPWRELR